MLQTATQGWTWYAGEGLLELHKRRSDNRETVTYALMANATKVGQIKQSFDRSWTPITGYQAANLSQSTFYLLNDHLGSAQVLVSSAGKKLENLSFDAWGERRAAGWNPNGVATPALDLLNHYALTTGFTGHEQDDTFGFINMKGRIYDPGLGRFLSADPFVQAPGNTQSYNRYSYVMNNPLSLVDPSGYNWLSDAFDWIGDNIRTIAAIGIGIVTGGWGFSAFAPAFGGFWGAVAGGAIGGFSSALVATGSLEAAVTAGVFGALSGGLANSIGHGILGRFATGTFGSAGTYIAHGVAQGVVSVLQGGKFRSGMIGGVFGHLSGKITGTIGGLGTTAVIARTMVAAAVGGTISDLTGGKFANGAMSAAFVHLFNNEAYDALTAGYPLKPGQPEQSTS